MLLLVEYARTAAALRFCSPSSVNCSRRSLGDGLQSCGLCLSRWSKAVGSATKASRALLSGPQSLRAARSKRVDLWRGGWPRQPLGCEPRHFDCAALRAAEEMGELVGPWMVTQEVELGGFRRRLALAPEAVARRSEGRPLPGSAKLCPERSRQACSEESHRSRAGPLPRGHTHFDHAAVRLPQERLIGCMWP